MSSQFIINNAKVGIETWSNYQADEVNVNFPKKHTLPPDGKAIESNTYKLYDINPHDKYMKLILLQPYISDVNILRPSQFEVTFSETIVALESMATQMNHHEFKEAAAVMRESKTYGLQLTEAMYALIKV